MMPRRAHAGFVLIEMVTTLVLVGVIGAFAAFFLYNGINGYIASKRNSVTAMAAQAALDRISYELRHIASLETATAPPVLNTSLTYRSTLAELPGVRRLRYDSKTIYFSRHGGRFDLHRDFPLVRWGRGVKCVLGFGGYPIPLSDEVIGIVKERLDDQGVVRMKQNFKPNDVVKIKSGPEGPDWDLRPMGFGSGEGENSSQSDRIPARCRASLFGDRESGLRNELQVTSYKSQVKKLLQV